MRIRDHLVTVAMVLEDEHSQLSDVEVSRLGTLYIDTSAGGCYGYNVDLPEDASSDLRGALEQWLMAYFREPAAAVVSPIAQPRQKPR
jgi:hypothetical protein